MPQLDITIFFNQLFWFFLSFFIIYILNSYWVIPKINLYYLIRHNIQSNIAHLDTQFDVMVIKNLINNESDHEFKIVKNYTFANLDSGFYSNKLTFVEITDFRSMFSDISQNILKINFLIFVK